MPEEKRFVLARVTVSAELAESRRRKRVPLEGLRGETLALDGYNVLITTESLLGGMPVYRCDDGFLRDVRGIFRHYRSSELTCPALREILSLLHESEVESANVLLDQQISKSGELARKIRGMMAAFEVPGTAKTARDVDRRLKVADAVVATGDGNVIDAASRVVDLPAEVARGRDIETLSL